MRQYWSPEEDAVLRAFYPVEGTCVYQRLVGRTATGCKSRARKLGIRKDLRIRTDAQIAAAKVARPKAIEAMRISKIGRHRSDATKAKISAKAKAWRKTPEGREWVELRQQAQIGTKASVETRKKMSQVRKGRQLSEQWKANISAGLRGLKRPAMRGANNPACQPGIGAKISQAKKGSTPSATPREDGTRKYETMFGVSNPSCRPELRRQNLERTKQWWKRNKSRPEVQKHLKRAVKAMISTRPTQPEKILYGILDELGCIFERQKSILSYFPDAYVPCANLCIEANGNYVHAYPPDYPNPNTFQKTNVERQKKKVIVLTRQGYNVLILWEHVLKADREHVKALIEHALVKGGGANGERE